jgi:3-hydroxybutyryl-CoA dehydratase
MNAYRWNELHVGMSHSFEARVTQAMMERFRADSGDDNPLHWDPAFARERGFAREVVYGLLSSAFYSTLVSVYLPGRNVVLQGIRVRFHKPIYVDMPLQVTGTVAHMSDAVRRIEIDARIENPDGDLLSTAKIEVGLHG